MLQLGIRTVLKFTSSKGTPHGGGGKQPGRLPFFHLCPKATLFKFHVPS